MAERRGELFIGCRESPSARIAHFSTATGRWAFDTLHAGSAPFELSSFPDGSVGITGNGKPIAVFDQTWREGAPLPTAGLPAPPSSALATARGVDWAVAAGGVWVRPHAGTWSLVELPAGAQPVSVAEGGGGDVWVKTKDDRWLRDRPLDGIYSCNTERRPGFVFERRPAEPSSASSR
jgi:streptogramin lyase